MLRVFYIVQFLFITLGFKLAFANNADEDIKIGQTVLVAPSKEEGYKYYEGVVINVLEKNSFLVRLERLSGNKIEDIHKVYNGKCLIPSVESYEGGYAAGKKILWKNTSGVLIFKEIWRQNSMRKISIVFKNGIMRVKKISGMPYFDDGQYNYININTADISLEVNNLGWLKNNGKFRHDNECHKASNLFQNGVIYYDYIHWVNFSQVQPDHGTQT
jgi:hypothetical protein